MKAKYCPCLGVKFGAAERGDIGNLVYTDVTHGKCLVFLSGSGRHWRSRSREAERVGGARSCRSGCHAKTNANMPLLAPVDTWSSPGDHPEKNRPARRQGLGWVRRTDPAKCLKHRQNLIAVPERE